MASLRDLFVTLGIEFDGKGAQKANQSLNNLKGEAVKTGSALQKAFTFNQVVDGIRNVSYAFGAVKNALGGVLEAASSAQETDSLLEQVFGADVGGIRDFASETSKAIGRSEFQLRRFAGTIGAIVSPQLTSMGAAGEQATANISKEFAKLSIDLASFYNTSEDQALNALRSGISGESEPLKQFGVNLTEEGMANALGISKKQLRSMDVAEKTMARFRAIMILTEKAQGDAARTSDGYANTIRALEGGFENLSVVIGTTILPVVTDIAKGFQTVTKFMADNAKSIGIILIPALSAAAAAFIYLKGQAILAGIASLAPWLLLGAALLGIGLVIEDIYQLFTGGESVIGNLIDKILGIDGAAQKIVESIKTLNFWDVWIEGIETLWTRFKQFFGDIKSGIMNSGLGRALSAVGDFFGFGGDVPSVPRPAAAPPGGQNISNSATNMSTVTNVNMTVNSNDGRRVADDFNRRIQEHQRQTARGVRG